MSDSLKSEQSTEHIKNSEVKFIYDSIFQKMSRQLREKYNNQEYGILGREAMYLANILFEKYKIQFYSIMQLTYDMTHNTTLKYKYFDIPSINTLIRACYETYLTFRYIFMLGNTFHESNFWATLKEEEKYRFSLELKVILYKYEGYKQSIQGLSMVEEKQREAIQCFNEIKRQLHKNKLFNSLTDEKRNGLEDRWRPSWNEIARESELSTWNSKNMYNILSQYGHNSYASLISLDCFYKNPDSDYIDAINMQLYEITSLFINDYFRLNKLDSKQFSKDEINILNEFAYYAKCNPKDIK